MTCGCSKVIFPEISVPDLGFNKATEILPGENIDCYSRRAGVNALDDAPTSPINKIANTSLTSNSNAEVSEILKMTSGSEEPANWTIWTDSQAGAPPGLTYQSNGATATLIGTVPDAHINRNYKVEIKAFRADGTLLDSRQFNFYPKKAKAGEGIKFVMPYRATALPSRVSSKFGPRTPPRDPRSGNLGSSFHGGVDFASGPSPANIVAADRKSVV